MLRSTLESPCYVKMISIDKTSSLPKQVLGDGIPNTEPFKDLRDCQQTNRMR